MAKWLKKFRAWENAREPAQAAEVEAILGRVFGSLLTESKGTSHRWKIDVSDIAHLGADYKWGQIGICVHHGATVKAAYLNLAYRAADDLRLLDDLANEEKSEDE